jgi:hypothetical protein
MIWPESLCHPATSISPVDHPTVRRQRWYSRRLMAPATGVAIEGHGLTGPASPVEARGCHPSFARSWNHSEFALARGCASGIREFRRRFGPARSEERNRSYHHSVETCASQRRPIQCNRRVRFHSEIVLLGIVGHFRSYFSHPNLELRVILNSWKTPPPLRP